ncbi:hypothetical protein ABZR11_29010 [Pseudomonas aeruginosa]|uniref:Uncharacterized protein n=1 Tax=Pseudomonas aeruginosa TaxID=287 RepID=A0A7I8E8G2_PSEAI|nr:hypothetical protein [Pseudomonas aeruginosa]EIU3538693.1 hypothetical protein [Pseudomonas aeruginosa]EKU5195772.1 hypothetical protein [Pseudomonas aeruginosa]EKW2948527.1 hypothetical protein [Pseudomonas aeruginosa]EKX2591913.1 hypothetical protein [Pseudomonas aeruginosa]ELH4079701.1 hypothetical protein [Pseudomonas aeruginosa]
MQNVENTVFHSRATEEDRAALIELAEWMEKHQGLLLSGLTRGIGLGVTPPVAEFIASHIGGNAGLTVRANLYPVPVKGYSR